jgi:hypothetical protein
MGTPEQLALRALRRDYNAASSSYREHAAKLMARAKCNVRPTPQELRAHDAAVERLTKIRRELLQALLRASFEDRRSA